MAFLRRWRAWLPPIVIVAAFIVVVATMGDKGAGSFHYSIF